MSMIGELIFGVIVSVAMIVLAGTLFMVFFAAFFQLIVAPVLLFVAAVALWPIMIFTGAFILVGNLVWMIRKRWIRWLVIALILLILLLFVWTCYVAFVIIPNIDADLL